MDLLLLTKNYPYGTGEAFIENEIKVLASRFDSVTIVACEVPSSVSSKRNVPDNVITYRINGRSKILDIVSGIFKSLFRNDEYKEEFKRCDSLVKRIFLSYFEEKSRRIFSSIKASGFLTNLKKDQLIIYSYWLFTTARVGTLLDDMYGCRGMVSRAHRYDLYENVNKLNYLPYRELFLKRYNAILPCSDNGTMHLRNMYPKYAEKVQTANLGTLDHGEGTASNDGVFRIVSCSRLEPVKRVDRIIDALKLLEKTGISIEWTHIGTGSQEKKIFQLAKERLHNTKWVLAGNMRNQDVMDYYAHRPVDLFINTSSSEGLPVSIMEAMSFGIPCIGTNVGGTSEIILDGITGKLIPEDFDTEELAEQIHIFINSDVADMRKNCRSYWLEHFEASQNYDKLCQKILSL